MADSTPSRLSNVFKTFMPPPRTGLADSNYTGVELQWKMFVIRPALFKWDLIGLALVLVYILWSFVGRRWNKRIADSWANHWRAVINKQVAVVNVFKHSPTLADGPTDFLTYASGRRGMERLYTHIHTRPRHDIFQQLFNTAWSLVDFNADSADNVSITATLTPGAGGQDVGFVYALVRKSKMTNLRKKRFDLGLTRTVDGGEDWTDFAPMAEVHALATSFAKPHLTGLVETVREKGDLLNWLIISDQPAAKPTKGPLNPDEKERVIELNLRLPEDVTALTPYIMLVFNLIDAIHLQKLSLNADTLRRLQKNRVELGASLAKEYAKQLEDEEEERTGKSAEERKRIAKKAIEDAKYEKMSNEDRRKYEEKERKKVARKAQPKPKMKR
ncbi:UPF0674 endoplasmic reticulum membrane protein C2G5.01 [Wallemia ichthyophaga EXF-994]|uniref:UPF0674 endoplasmic reticulum membrane protein C2G5.01 n=1 Tax=Wallemia ichthyophaga (strain EXF-994 / CBS 113033) TaxID=1299270 RepID=R9ABX4_WALI9|nr:UPF0674 endoplasmic reticulum membrane protein C2G5.01 [Wallemia ichthyophaga EXF-994]EOQ99637.1 UPF0674 endoplasmic reticulum membrane protein C2G5.01 [Wallemia ichthyophaga EXF-994]TIB35663.1 hypothetical protein E3P84_01320 [Wallemia ichthyophaga]TIB42578.1 hypothetical protein E3P83_01111 [Wallemia ichthyophaga]